MPTSTGRHSRAWQIDRDVPALGQYHATRRVARTIFLGATPNVGHANRGMEIDRIRLGSTFAGEKPGFVADALNRLSAQAPVPVPGPQPLLVRPPAERDPHRSGRGGPLADRRQARGAGRDRPAAPLRARATATSGASTMRRRRAATSPTTRWPGSSCSGPTRPTSPRPRNRPRSSRLSRCWTSAATALVSTATCWCLPPATSDRWKGLEQATADYIAWSSICDRVQELNLDAHQTTQAKTRRQQSDDAVGLRLAEAYKYALVPRQDDPTGPVTFDVVTLDQQGSVAQRVSRKLVSQGNLAVQFPAVMLRLKLDNELSSRWEQGHVSVAQLWEDFAKYVYLPRLRDQDVLMTTIESGPSSTVWQSEGFAIAAGIDEKSDRYLGLTAGSRPDSLSPTAVLVKPEFALGQMETDAEADDAGSCRDLGRRRRRGCGR